MTVFSVPSAMRHQELSWARIPIEESIPDVQLLKPAMISFHPEGVAIDGFSLTPTTAMSRSPLEPAGTLSVSDVVP
ncbi:MAG: hypothetical protein ACR2O6_06820 [Ilumatobacteraceae bacterium]